MPFPYQNQSRLNPPTSDSNVKPRVVRAVVVRAVISEPNLVQNLTHLRPKEVTSPPPYLKTKTFAMTPEATSWARVALHKFKLENYKNYKSISI